MFFIFFKEFLLLVFLVQDKRFFLDLDIVIERFQWFQQVFEMGVFSLMVLVIIDWWCYGYMERYINEICIVVDKVELFLKEYFYFVKGVVVNVVCFLEFIFYNKMKWEL